MSELPKSEEVIRTQCEPIAQAEVDAFRVATGTEDSIEIPLTFASRFREAEYQWLDRYHIEVKELLHGEQEYEYLESLQVGDAPDIRTRVTRFRERKRPETIMQIISMETEVFVGEVKKIVFRTDFIAQKPLEKT